MAYVQLSDLAGSIPSDFLTQALDDNEDGVADAGVFAGIAADAGNQIDGYIGMRYALPLVPDFTLYPNTYGFPAVVTNAARVFTLEQLYKRRGTTDDKNPWAVQAGQTRTLLKAISLGQSPLAPELTRKDPTASVVTQPMRTAPRGAVSNA
jgi:hypothetical protein